jgi:hypothetical protein
MTLVDLGLSEQEHQVVLTAPLTLDWISFPEWYSAFRKWAEASGESHGLWLGDLYYVQMQIDVAKDPSATQLWQEYLLYLPTDGAVPQTAMADIEKLARGEEIDRSVGELLNEMSDFMINDVYGQLTHTYVFGPFSETIAEYKRANGVADDEQQESDNESGHADDAHYGLSALPEDDDGHYGTSPLPDDEHTYDTYPGSDRQADNQQADNDYETYPGSDQQAETETEEESLYNNDPGSSQTPPREFPPIDQVVDFDTIQEENQRALKEAQEPGTRLPFWQVGTWILLGPGHDPASYQHLLDRGAASGYVTVVSRANNLRRNPGLIQVQGSNDPDAFSETIGRFSNKRVEFV